MDEILLKFELEALIRHPESWTVISSAVAEANAQLKTDADRIAVSIQVPVGEFAADLPGDIRSCRVFILRRDKISRIECHPNSHQHVVSIEGNGWIRVFEEDTEGKFSQTANLPLFSGQAWASVKEGTWHQPVAGDQDWIVLAFHTVDAEVLITEYLDEYT